MTRSGSAIDETTLKEEIRAFLQAHHVASLATIVHGAAHAASVMFAVDDLSLYWTSDPGTRHSLAIEGNAQVGATVAPDYADFRAIRGLQIAGRARRLCEAAEAAHARELLRRRFPFLLELDRQPAALRAALDKAAYYRLDPDSVTLIDNSKGFGNRQTLQIGRGASSGYFSPES